MDYFWMFILFVIFTLCLIFYLKYREKEYNRLLQKYNHNESLCKELLLHKNLEKLYDKYKDLELAKTLEEYEIEDLYEKYNDVEISLKIKRGTIWIGMTKDMLIDSWGEPGDIKKDISTGKVKYDKNGQPNMNATLLKVKEIYKYGCVGKNRYTNHVYLLNDIVTGWKK